MEGALRLVGADCGILSAQQARELEEAAFDWILNCEKHVDHRFPDLHRLRDRVRGAPPRGGGAARAQEGGTHMCSALGRRSPPAAQCLAVSPGAEWRAQVVLGSSKLLGCISSIQLDSIAERFLAESGARLRADASSPQRFELFALCHGLRFVRLRGDTPAQVRLPWVEAGWCLGGEARAVWGCTWLGLRRVATVEPLPASPQLEASINFLERVHPLKSVAPQKKSRVQQAICDMLACVLQPLADLDDPRCAQHKGGNRP